MIKINIEKIKHQTFGDRESTSSVLFFVVVIDFLSYI
jgi:hypothetical protein